MRPLDSTSIEHRRPVSFRNPFDTDEIRLFRFLGLASAHTRRVDMVLAHASRAFRLLAMHLVEETLQRFLQRLVFSALVELADKVPADFEGVEAEMES